jgi:hypothetical protein
MKMVQTQLVQGNANVMTWLPQDPRVRVGSVIELQKAKNNLSGTWQVAWQSQPQEDSTIQRGWGLDLPKSARTER